MNIIIFHLSVMFNVGRRSSLTGVEYSNLNKISNSILAVAIGNTVYVRLLQRRLRHPNSFINFKTVFITSLTVLLLISYFFKERIYKETTRIDMGMVNIYVLWSVYLYYLLSILLGKLLWVD